MGAQMLMLESEALANEAWWWFGIGLGAAFVITTVVVVLLFLHSIFEEDLEHKIDLGFLGLIVLLVSIFYLIAFSILVAASARGLDIKLLVAAVDAFVLMGGRLLAPEFLRYLNDEAIGGGVKPGTTVWLYEGDDRVNVFATEEDAKCWLKQQQSEGTPFECLVTKGSGSAASNFEDTKRSCGVGHKTS